MENAEGSSEAVAPDGLEEPLSASFHKVEEIPAVSPPPREIGLSFRRSTSLKSDIKSDLEEYHAVTDTYDLAIRFKTVNVTACAPEQAESYETFGKKLLGFVLAPCRILFGKKAKLTSIKVLDDVTGYIMPGSMTSVIGPTGSGKTTLLKVLAGHFKASKLTKLEGKVLYNDSVLTPDLQTKRPIAYVTGLHNVHLPVFTIRETLEFAEKCTRRLRPRALTSQVIKCFTPDLLDSDKPFLEYILQTFGLKYIENIMVTPLLKESARARLTTAEIAMRTFSVLLYDQPTTEEDSLRMFDRIHNLLNTVIRVQRCAAVVCLVQVSPEVFELFDRVILLSEGRVIYQGPRYCVEDYFSRLGFVRPAYVDSSVFLQDIAAGVGARYTKAGSSAMLTLEDLAAAYQVSDHFRDISRIVSSKEVIHVSWVEVVSDIQTSIEDTPDGPGVFVTDVSDDEEMATNGVIRIGDEITAVIIDDSIQYVKASSPAEQEVQAHKAFDLLNEKRSGSKVYVQLERKNEEKQADGACFKRKRFGGINLADWWWSTTCLLERQKTFTFRFKILYVLRFIQVLIVGLYAGSLFYKKGGKIDQYEMISLRTIGFVSMMNLMLINLIQLPIHLLIHRPVFQKHQAQKLFPVSSYLVSHLLISLPQSLLEAFIYSMCTYFLANLSLDKGGRYFEYLALIFLISYMGSCFCLLVGGFAPILESAMAIAGLFILVSLLFSGVIVLPSVVPRYWRWMLYIIPTRWGNIIFSSTQIRKRYHQPCTSHLNFQFCLVSPQLTVGKAFVKFYQVDASRGRLVLSYGGIVIFILALNLLSYLAYKRTRMPNLVSSSARVQHHQGAVHTGPEGSSKSSTTTGEVSKSSSDEALNRAENGTPKLEAGWTELTLPVRQLTLTFHDLNLYGPNKLQMLSHVSGFCKPGQMLALLGSTRAGKTTLLKCLSGRHLPLLLEGDLLVNGVKLRPTCFHRISGFAEKVETHQPFLTVRESLEFSASLRLRRSVTRAEKARHVDQVLELTGLSHVSNNLVGTFQQIIYRTKETTKKLTIAVELAANPSILFLDDPTAQLDGVGTRNVLHMLKTVAMNGRTLVFTLHHPSGETLSLFDKVLVLRQGEQIYFGPSGWHGRDLLTYFSTIPNVPPYDGHRSPVVYMLDILGGGTWKREPAADFPSAYTNSPLHAANLAELEVLREQTDPDLRQFDSRYIAPFKTQFAMVFLRNGRFLYRNVRYTFSRLAGLIIIALVMGTLYLNIDMEKSTSMQSGSLIMYIQAILICATTANNLIPQLGTDRQVYVRESRARMYKPILYPLSWLVSEIPYILLATLVFVGIANGMAGIGVDTFSMFMRYWSCFFLFTMVIVCYGIFLACVAPVPTIAVTCSSIVMSLWISSSGISVPRNKIRFYKWLYWIDPFQYTMNILTPAAFYCDTKTAACLSCRIGSPCPSGCSCKRLYDVERILGARTNRTQAVFVWDRLLASRPIEKDRNEWDYLALVGMAFLFATLAVTSFRWLKHNRA